MHGLSLRRSNASLIRYKFSKPILVACTASMMTLLAPAVNAQNTELKQVFAQLGATPVVRAQFEQQKKLASLNKTYVSKGTVLFSKNQGVLWQIQSPVKADLVVTPRKLVQRRSVLAVKLKSIRLPMALSRRCFYS